MDHGDRTRCQVSTCDNVMGEDLTGIIPRIKKSRCRVTIDDIVSVVCHHYGVSEAELAAPGKVRRPSEVRAAAALLVRELPGLSLTAPGTRLRREVSV